MKFPKLDKYILFEVIGRGGMGEVYLAKNPGFDGIGKFLAIKKIRAEYMLDPEMVRLFRREAQVAIRLSHSNIASIYEFGTFDGSFFLVMEFVPGPSLDNIFQSFQAGQIHLGPQETIHMIIQVASALSYAHRFVDPETLKPAPVIHRDISPHNVLISYEGEVKLIDFGIARMEGNAHQTQPGSVMGKVVYMSPEQMRGEGVDHRTDIYALGIIMWELLTGVRYYSKVAPEKIRARLLEAKGPRPLPDNLPYKPELEEFLSHMMAPDPANRYSTAEELVADLQLFHNQNFPGHSQMNIRNLIHEAYAEDHHELKAKLSRFSQIQNKLAHETMGEADDVDKTEISSPAGGTSTMPTLTVQAPPTASTAQTQADLRRLVEDVINTKVSTTITSNTQPLWKKYLRLRYVWLAMLIIFTVNMIFNAKYRNQLMQNLAVLDDLHERVYKNREDIQVVTGQDGKVVGVKVGDRVVAGSETDKGITKPPPVVAAAPPVKPAPQPVKAIAPVKIVLEQPETKTPKTPAKDSRVPASKKKKKPRYQLFVDSSPRGADIYINGKKYPRQTPTYVKFRTNKTIRIELSKKGYSRHTEFTSPSIGVLRPKLRGNP